MWGIEGSRPPSAATSPCGGKVRYSPAVSPAMTTITTGSSSTKSAAAGAEPDQPVEADRLPHVRPPVIRELTARYTKTALILMTNRIVESAAPNCHCPLLLIRSKIWIGKTQTFHPPIRAATT